MLNLNLDHLNDEFEAATAEEILQWAKDIFQAEIAATSSFQTQSLPLLHLISRVIPQLPVFFLDTGFHFPETITFRDRLIEQYGLNVISLKPELGMDEFRLRYGDLYLHNPELCCYVNKVEPLNNAMKDMKAWISGIRRDQTNERSHVQIIALEPDGKYKISPLANWTRKDVYKYINTYDLPAHPLFSQGYLSIGCAPCTRPVFNGQPERDGRWAGQQKTECGLHVALDLRKLNKEKAEKK